jgi:hypothetical protein
MINTWPEAFVDSFLPIITAINTSLANTNTDSALILTDAGANPNLSWTVCSFKYPTSEQPTPSVE